MVSPTSSSFCPQCQQIPFDGFRCPTPTRLAASRKAQQTSDSKAYQHAVWGRDLCSYNGSFKIPLGTWGRMMRDSTWCEMCRLFCQVVSRRGATYMDGRRLSVKNEDVVFYTTGKVTMAVTESLRDVNTYLPDKLVYVRSIGLEARLREDKVVDGVLIREYESLALYNDVAQVCHGQEEFEARGARAPDMVGHVESIKHMLFRGRRRPDTVDLRLLKRWLNICGTEHSTTCGKADIEQSAAPVKLIRFIDTALMCLCTVLKRTLASIQYCTLSYCWGKAKQVMLTEDRESELHAGGSLSMSKTPQLPQTIRDAIELCHALNIRYIWVDALCIRQGKTAADIEDKQYQLAQMGAIYQNGLMAIVAAGGDSADAGLPGFRPGTRTRNFQQQPVTVIAPHEDPDGLGVALVATCNARPVWTGSALQDVDAKNEAEGSVWYSRAWTLQERVLSRRMLIFTSELVTWVCDGAFFSEESSFEPPPTSSDSSSPRGTTTLRVQPSHKSDSLTMKTLDGRWAQEHMTGKNFWDLYSQLVVRCASRDLSFDGDIYDTFQSIAEALSARSGEVFHWGHPRSRFALSLVWGQEGKFFGLSRRSACTTLPMTNLKTSVRLPSWSWMAWKGMARLDVSDEQAETAIPSIICYEHSTEPMRLIHIHGSNNFESLQASTSPATSSIVTWANIHTHCPSLTQEILAREPHGHIIFFWTQSATLYVEHPAFASPNTTRGNHYRDGRKRTSDYPNMRLRPGDEKFVGTVDLMDEEYWNTSPPPSGMHEFVAVARRHQLEGMEEFFQPMILALQIRWVEGFAVRVNVAEIEERAWLEAGPVRKLIPLA